MIADFYDKLADNYHRIFPDWSASVDRQAAILERMLVERGVEPGASVLDCSAGIGTQSIGLASRGYAVTATDISPRSIEQARATAEERALDIAFAVADFRHLDRAGLGQFDAVISFDNAIAHMLDDADLVAALDSMRAHAREGAPLLVSTRNYQGDGPRPIGTPLRTTTTDPRFIYGQSWTWHDDGDDAARYDTDLFLLEQHASGWHTHHARTTMRVWAFDDLLDAATRAAWRDVEILRNESTGYYQPVLAGRA